MNTNDFTLVNSKTNSKKKSNFQNRKKRKGKKKLSKEQLEKKIKKKNYSLSKRNKTLQKKNQLSLKLQNNDYFFTGLEEEEYSYFECCNNYDYFNTGPNNDYDSNQKLIPKKFHNNPEIKRYYVKQINFRLINKYYNEYKKIDDKIREIKTFSFYYLLKKIENYLYLLGLPYIVIKQILGYFKSYFDWSINSKMRVIEEIYKSLPSKNYSKFEFDRKLQAEYDILRWPQYYYYDLW